ncbi:MAG: ATP-binding protein, partial [Limisphaerales bacterium]
VGLVVKDNGRGLPQHFEKRQGMGLKIMDYRASMVGAELQVQRRNGGGTQLTCSLRNKPDQRLPLKI